MPKEVLIIRFSALGDVAISQPLLCSLMKTYPEVHFHYLSKSFTKALFEDLEGPNFHFIGADVRNRHKGLLGLIRLCKEENLWRMDIVCDLHKNARSRFICLLLRFWGARIFCIDKQRKARRRLVRRHHKILKPLQPVLKQYGAVFEKAGFTGLTVTPISSEKKQSLSLQAESIYGKKEGQWIGIAPFAKHQGKIYPVNLMGEVISRLVASGKEQDKLFLFGGGQAEMAVFSEWKKSYPSLHIASGNGLKKDLEILSALDVLLTMDSANMHLASMVGTRTISIWGATHFYSGFYGIGQKKENMLSTEEPLSCRPCSIYGNRPCYRGDYACMNTIRPEQILQKITATIALPKPQALSPNDIFAVLPESGHHAPSKTKLRVQPDYENLRDFIAHLDEVFDKEGKCIYKSRNEIKVFEREGLVLNVKCFKRPLLINQFVYARIRDSKACRSYKNAMKILQLGIETPSPIGYLECFSGCLLTRSYYVSIHSNYSRSLKEFADHSAVAERRDIVEALGRYISQIHRAGILHKDLSCGNILFEKEAGKIHFSLVDINRMAFRRIGRLAGMKNMERLRGSDAFFRYLSAAYAGEMGYDAEKCYRVVTRYNRKSVRHFAQRVNQKDRRRQVRPDSIGVIISSYNHADWLEKTLWGYACQTRTPDEIIVADDGSTEETAQVIEAFCREYGGKVKHIWQEDKGFRKNIILNKALLAADSDYLIFTDQDCVPRYDLVETHWHYAERGYFLSSGYSRLNDSLSRQITREDIESHRVFDLKWLKQHGLASSFKNLKLWNRPLIARLMNHITTAKATFNGCNTSCWRSDLLQINGFNEQMEYGGEDREVGERLHNFGVKSKQIRFSAVCLHLNHKRPYKDPVSIKKNEALRKNTRKSKLIVTPAGISSEKAE